jgi:hypothetical protein
LRSVAIVAFTWLGVVNASAQSADPPDVPPGVAGDASRGTPGDSLPTRGRLVFEPGLDAPGGGPAIHPPHIDEPPTLDGRLDDEVWTEAARVTDFVQRNPVEGAPATEQTEVFIAYDSQNLYFGFYAHYSDQSLIRANRSDRDQFNQDDVISVYFDPFQDQQRAYTFTVNGYGVQGDSIIGGGNNNNGGGGNGGGGGGNGIPRGDSSWDALFGSAGVLVSDGWTDEGEPHQWGFQIARSIGSKNESDVWAPVTRDIQGFVRQMGRLQGMTNLSRSRNLEFLPTFTAIQLGSLDSSSGTFVQDDIKPEGGIGIKYGVSSDLIADFTFNPDFSQIESDEPQIEVNQRFPLFYPELRPFFLEGQDVFDTRGEVNLVHTRTIIDPRFGGKLSGKIGRGSVGVLVANDEAPGKVEDAEDPAFGRRAQFVVGRYRYDMYPGSYVGGLFTDRQFVNAYSRVGALDGRFRIGFTDRLDFRVAQSWNRFDDGAEHAGATYDLQYDHNGRNFDYNLRHYSVEPDFATATGFVQRTDTRRTQGQASYRWWPEGAVVNWGPGLTYARNYDFAGVLQDEVIELRTEAQFARNIRVNAGANRGMERYENIDFWKTTGHVFGQLGTSRHVSFGGGLDWGDGIFYSEDPFLGRSRDGRLFVNVMPFSRLRSNLQISYSHLTDPRTDDAVVDVKILRSLTTYQFTTRLLLRSILEFNTSDETFDANLLLTYRVNSGTVFFLGYDDHYQQENLIDASRFPTERFRQTNRALFTKLSYLFRY